MNSDQISYKLFSLNPLPSWIYDYETLDILDVNIAAIEHYGYLREEFLSMTLKDLRPPQEVPKLISAHTDIKSKEGNISFGIFTHQKKNGGLIQMDINGHKVEFNNRQCILVVCQDVTKKIEQQEVILQSEQRFKALIQEGSELITIIDAVGNYLYVSPTSTSITGFTPEEFIGRNVFEFIHPDDKERILASLEKLTTVKRLILEPFRSKNHKNEWRWVETILTNMLDNPAVNGIVSNTRDITKQKEEEHQLKLLSSVITNTNDAVLITEAEPFDEPGNRIIYVNDAFTKMTGYTAEEIIGKTPRILQGPNTNKEELVALGRRMRNWESCELTTINYKKNGEEFWVNFSLTPVADKNGWYTHWISIERDVTQQKQKELEKDLLGKISMNFSSEHDLFTSCAALCETISDYGRFDIVELWLPNIENTLIHLVANKSASLQADTFYKWSHEIKAFKPGEGLPGMVWSNRSSLLWENISKNDDFVRKNAAVKADINNALGIPLRFNEDIVGVLVVATQNELNKLKKHIKLFEEFEEFIGSEINRKKLESDLSHLFDAIPDILSVGDFQGRFLKINKSGCELLGYREDEILYHHYGEFIHPDDMDNGQKELMRLEKGETTFKYEARFLTKTGKTLWLSWYCNSSVEEGLIYATAKNITEEKKLRELNQQASKLTKIGSWELDFTNQTLYWSDEVYHLHETDPESFVPDLNNAIEFYEEDFRPVLSSFIEKCATSGEPIDFEAKLLTAKNNERWARVIGNAEIVDGECKRIFGSYQDIHERKLTELALLESEAKFKTIFEIASLGIIQVDPKEGRIILANSYYENITGYTNDELLNMSFVELTHPDDREKDLELFSKAARGDAEYRNEKRYVKKNGNIVWVRLHVTFVRDESGKPLKTVAICEDITNRKEAETRLQNLSDNIPGVVFQYLLYPDGTDEIRYVSKGSEKIWGYSPEEVAKNIDLVWNQTKAGGDFEEVKESIKDSFENKNQWSIRYRSVSPTGKKRILQGLGTPEFWADGTVLYNSVVLDITKEAQNEELLELATDLARIGSWEIDLVGNKLFWSEKLHELHETDPKTFVPDLATAINFYREDFLEMVNDKVAKCVEMGIGFDFEAVIITAKKQERWIRAIGNAELIDGKCQRIYGSFQDIHERKESELRLKSISDDLPGVSFQYVISPDGTDSLQGVSKAAYDVWNVSNEDCEQNNELVWDQIKKGGDFEAVQQSIQESIQKNTKWNFQWRNVLPNGEVRWHEGYGTPNILADGTIVFNSLIFDITEKHKAVELYNVASKMAKIGSWELNLTSQDTTDNMYWSPMLKEILEVDKDYNPSLTGGFEFYVGESKEKIRAAVDTMLKTGEDFDLELQVETTHKQIKWVRCIGKAEFVDGKCHRIFGSYQDISLPKSLEIQIREILESISDSFYAVDANWNFTYFNKEAESLLRKKYEDVIGKNIWIEFPTTIGTSIQEIFQRVAQTGISESVEYLFPGDGKWYEVHAYPYKGGISAYFKNIHERKVAAEEVQKAIQEKTNIIESISDAFFTLDKNWIVTYWNKEAENMMGRNREDILGKNIWDIYPEAIDSNFYKKYHNAMRTGETVNFEDYSSPVEKWFDITVYPSNEGLSIYFKDVSQRIESEQEKNSLQKTLENSLNEIYIFDSETLHFTYINKGALHNLGYSEHDIKALTPLDLKPDYTSTSFKQLIIPLVNNEKEKIVFFTNHKRKDGSLYPVEVHLQLIVEGNIKRFIAIILDITERKKAEELLDKSNRLARIGNWEVDLENEIVYWSVVTKEIHETEPDYVPDLSKGLNFYKEGVNRTRITQCVENCINRGEPWDEELQIVTLKGNLKWVRTIGKGEFRDGKCSRIYGSFQDITERKNQEELLLALNESLKNYTKELERSNEELEQFAFITSHDLQEPLRMISSFMDQLRRKYGDQLDDKALQYIYFATDGAKRMKQIILDLLEYSRAGKPIDSIEKVDLNQLLSEFKQLRRKIISEKAVTIATSELPTINSYKVAITQVLHALLDNAIKYSKEGNAPHIEINTTESMDEWRFSIKDNGIGIDSEFFDKIFIIFQRLHNRNEYDGTGIGLSIAKKHVEFLGGRIWVESNLREGSTFYFTIKKTQ